MKDVERNFDYVECERLSPELREEMEKALKYIDDKFGIKIYDGNLSAIKCEGTEDIKLSQYGGNYKSEEKEVIIYLTYYGWYVDEKTKETVKKFGGFTKAFMYWMGQFLYDVKDRFPKVENMYNGIMKSIEKNYSSTGNEYGRREIFVRFFAESYIGNLDRKI